MVLSIGCFSNGSGRQNSTVPDFVNIGALFSYNTSVGRTIKIALEAAFEDINSDPTILGRTKLNLSMQEDSKYRGFLSIAEGMSFTVSPLLCVKSLKNNLSQAQMKLLQLCQIIALRDISFAGHGKTDGGDNRPT